MPLRVSLLHSPQTASQLSLPWLAGQQAAVSRTRQGDQSPVSCAGGAPRCAPVCQPARHVQNHQGHRPQGGDLPLCHHQRRWAVYSDAELGSMNKGALQTPILAWKSCYLPTEVLSACGASAMPAAPAVCPAAGYRASGTHTIPLGCKTDAPFHILWDILRCWVQDHPVKGADPESAGVPALPDAAGCSVSWLPCFG